LPASPRVSQAHAHLATALTAFVPETDLATVRAGDLALNQQVDHYSSAGAQQRYAHMYGAKHLGIWTALRRQLPWEDRIGSTLVSVGAGPLLDLLGWCLESSWTGAKWQSNP
jgi:hypothetical protein